MHNLSLFCIVVFVKYIYCALVILPLHLHYIYMCIDVFVHYMVSALICVFMLYNIIIVCV